MVERIEANQQSNNEMPVELKTSREHSLVESLLGQLGIPEERVKHCAQAYYTAFGPEDQPTERIIVFLEHKIAISRK
ncbi:MAG: hypothetical protein ACD_38C00135G0001 [uncultured bacterium]|nr:MAG: hypothetical protein ACD_38C00135G0001 [uncultured bacterium]